MVYCSFLLLTELWSILNIRSFLRVAGEQTFTVVHRIKFPKILFMVASMSYLVFGLFSLLGRLSLLFVSGPYLFLNLNLYNL